MRSIAFPGFVGRVGALRFRHYSAVSWHRFAVYQEFLFEHRLKSEQNTDRPGGCPGRRLTVSTNQPQSDPLTGQGLYR